MVAAVAGIKKPVSFISEVSALPILVSFFVNSISPKSEPSMKLTTPTFSAALAEGQSMFLDSLVSDAAWRAKYARDKDGKPIPFEIVAPDAGADEIFPRITAAECSGDHVIDRHRALPGAAVLALVAVAFHDVAF